MVRPGRPFAGKDGGNHLLDRGLAAAAGDANDGRGADHRETAASKGGKISQGPFAVGDCHQRCFSLGNHGRHPLDHQARRPLLQGLGEIIMGVVPFSLQGNEYPAPIGFATIGLEAGQQPARDGSGLQYPSHRFGHQRLAPGEQRVFRFESIVEKALAFQRQLIGLVPLASNEDNILGTRCPHRLGNGTTTIADDQVTGFFRLPLPQPARGFWLPHQGSDTGDNAGDDLLRILGARIIVGYHHHVAQGGRDFSHQRAFAVVTIATAAKHAEQPAMRQSLEGVQHLLQGIGRVGVVDQDHRPRRWPGRSRRYPLQTPRRALGRGQRATNYRLLDT